MITYGFNDEVCGLFGVSRNEDKEFPCTFDDGLQYFEVFRDTVLIDKFDTSHESAHESQVAQYLQDLLNSLD